MGALVAPEDGEGLVLDVVDWGAPLLGCRVFLSGAKETRIESRFSSGSLRSLCVVVEAVVTDAVQVMS